MIIGLVVALGIVGGSIALWLPLRAKLRGSRLAPITAAIAKAECRLVIATKLPEQAHLGQSLQGWIEASEARDAMVTKVEATPFPTIAAPTSNETFEETCQRIARLLENRKLVLAAAGGEQVVQNLFEISPEAANHIAAGAATLYQDGLVQFALTAATAGLPEALRQALNTGLLDLIQHGGGLHVVTGLPGHFADTLHAAGSHVMQGMHDIGNQLQHSGTTAADSSVADHHGGGVGAHVPWLTILLSSIREINLVFEKKTTRERALAHVVIDATATGLGAAGGAKLGAIVGSFVAPGIGTGMGGLIGAAVGAVVGRSASEKVKRVPLEALRVKFDKVADVARGALSESASTFASALHEASTKASTTYKDVVGKAPDFSQAVQRDATQRAVARQLLQHLHAELDATAELVLRELQSIPQCTATTWERLAGLDVSSAARDELRKAEERCRSWAARMHEGVPVELESPYDTFQALVVTPCHPASAQHFRLAAHHAAQFAPEFMRCVGAWLANATAVFQAGTLSIQAVANDQSARHGAIAGKWRDQLQDIEQEIVAECAALGIQLPPASA
jgi:hypothetical protein